MKPEIHISNLTKGFGDKILLENINLHFRQGDKIGIIGNNGCGKSTFLRLLYGELQPDDGGIGNRNSIAYMRQEISCDLDTTVYEYLTQHISHWEEYKIYEMIEKFHLNIDTHQKLLTLSGGEQKKIDLISIILQNADVLLLDEPTNHLDQLSLELLQKTIEDHPGIVLFVSHDRHFLNMMANKILEIDKGNITIFHGDYEYYKIEKESRYQKQLSDYVVYKKEKDKWESWLNDLRQRASVYVNPAWGRLLRNKEKFFNREILGKKVEKPTQDRTLSMKASGGTHQKKLILEIYNHSINIGGSTLIKDFNLSIRGSERIQITGANGSGKTSLITHIVDCFQEGNNDSTKVGEKIHVEYFDQQNQLLMSNDTPFKRLCKNIKSSSNEQSIISQLAVIGLSQSEIFSPMNTLSYGQRVKLKFLQMLSARIDLLILDEPTNHLDISTRESIEDMLEDYEGALLFVSHDQYFTNKLSVSKKYHIKNMSLEVVY